MFGSWREDRDSRRKGRRDGRVGVPAADQVAPPFDLREIHARAQQRVEEVLKPWRIRDQDLASEHADHSLRAVEAEARLKDAEERLDAATSDHERRTAQEDERLARWRAELEGATFAEPAAVAMPEVERPSLVPIAGGARPRPELVRPASEAEQAAEPADASRRGIGRYLYWLAIAVIVAAEFPLNAIAFRVFGESDLFTYVMTLGLAVGLVVSAHFLGVLLARPERTRIERVLVAVCVAIPLGAIVMTSLVRYDYLALDGDSNIGPLLGMAAFVLINLVVFGAAVWLSYLRHDPRTQVSRLEAARTAERDRARTERRRDREERRRERRLRRRQAERRKVALDQLKETHQANLEARQGENAARRAEAEAKMRPIHAGRREREERLSGLRVEVEAARTAFGEAQRAAQAMDAERRALHDATDAELRAIRARLDGLWFAYAGANVRARADHAAPACLQAVPPLVLPAEFRDPVAEGSLV